MSEYLEKLAGLKKYETEVMSYNYKDLNYIREALAHYEKHLCDTDINACDDDEAEELQD